MKELDVPVAIYPASEGDWFLTSVVILNALQRNYEVAITQSFSGVDIAQKVHL